MDRIVQAAIVLLEREGRHGLTMRNLAAEAGVSEATPYNLFTSKAGVLTAVYRSVFDSIALAPAPEDPLDRLLGGAAVVARTWVETTSWFRELMVSAREVGAEFPTGASGPRHILRRDIDELRAERLLGDEIDPDVLVEQILYTNRGIYEAWITGALADHELTSALVGSVALSLLGCAHDDLRPRLIEALRALAS